MRVPGEKPLPLIITKFGSVEDPKVGLERGNAGLGKDMRRSTDKKEDAQD